MLKLLHPELFQGNLNKKKYFEGWYFKHVSKDLSNVYSFIPGISLSEDDPHSFIQVINGISGKTCYITYSVNDFRWKRNRLHLEIGNSLFTDRFIELDIDNQEIIVSGRLEYSGAIKYPKRLPSPGIMGWYSYIPFMECKHGIVSVNHKVSGVLKIDNDIIDMNEGKGYIEKDWGSSFPEAWIWIQSNNFENNDTAFTFSVAKIPWLGKYFPGFISFLHYDNRFFLFSSYNKSSLDEISYDGKTLSFTLRNADSVLKVTAVKNKSGELMAPVSGKMTRRIKESIDSSISVSLYDRNNKLIYNDSAQRAGLEIIDKIFDYL